ncbi:hypothetical protein RB597_007942 [Gaeumannomyces tritici]
MAYEPRGGGGGGGDFGGGGADGTHLRPRGRRPVTDYSSTLVHWMRHRDARYKGGYQGEVERPSPSYIIDMLPPHARVTNAADSLPVRHLHSSLNKVKHPINVVKWTPEGRRLLTASTGGEFTLWNGTGFNFETIMQAHEAAIRALAYSHRDEWLLSGDHDGIIHYWQPNFNNVETIRDSKDTVRDIAFAPNDSKFVVATDDAALRVYDFAAATRESTLSGHHWEAKACDWHPTKGLIVSGSKDHLVKLWDPRSSRCLTTLRGHKNTITKTLFERVRGMCLATSARDQTARVFDLRMMRDICLLRGHDKDVSSLAWHPIHPNLLSTGGAGGALLHYILDEPNTPDGRPPTVAPYDSADPAETPAQVIFPAHRLNHAHDFGIWSLDWHPLGHIMASGSNDRITRFWTRARPGDGDNILNDRYHIGEDAAEARGTWDRRGQRRQRQEEEEQEKQDELEGLVDQKAPVAGGGPPVPLLPGLTAGMPGLNLAANPGAAAAIPGFKTGGLDAGGNSSAVPPPPLPLPFPLLGPDGRPLPMPDPNNPPDFAALAEMMQKAGLPMPQPGMLPPGLIPPPPPGMAGAIPGFPPPPPLLPPGLGFPGGAVAAAAGPGAPLVPPIPGFPGLGGAAAAAAAAAAQDQDDAGRRRAPLPSQEESLRMEQNRGHYTRAR